MDETAARPLKAVQGDLLRSTGLRLRILDEPATDDIRYDSFWLVASEGLRTGILVTREQSESERLVSVADQIQEFVHEQLSILGRPAAWPVCPEHPHNHPLAAELIDDQPSWRCPVSGVVTAHVGSLAESTGSS